MINNLIKKKNIVFLAVMVLTLLVVGCSSTSEDLDTADQTGVLKLSVEDSSSDSLASSLSETNNQLGIVVENKADQSERYESEEDLATNELEFAFDNLKNDAQYQIRVQVKDSSGDVLYQLLETDVTINSDAITKEDFDLSDYQLGDMDSLATSGNQAEIYYKHGFDTPYIHYAVDGSWTDAPGVEMQDSDYAGYSVITIDLGDVTELEAAFNDGDGNWDSNGGDNYIFQDGTWTFDAGNITEGAPEVNQAEIYYKRGFETPYIHYAVDGSWTDSPGEAMQDSDYAGYSVITIDLGDATELEAAFNDGDGNWDSNGEDNYIFQDGTWTFDDGSIAEGAPESSEDTTAPSAPSDLTVDSTTESAATISWTAATDDVGVAGYNVYRDGSQIDSTTELNYTDSSLTADTSYDYTVEAYDEAGNISDTSNQVTATTEAASSGNQAEIYYKRGFETPYIHYAVDSSWTDAPGEVLQDSDYDGYSVITIDLEDATELEAAFNDGDGNWDSNGGDNYIFQDGTWTFDAGNITEGAPDSNDDGSNDDDSNDEEPSSELPDIPSDKVNQTMYQAFYWNMDAGLWTQLQSQATDFAEIGITSMWLPPATKAWGGDDGADGSVGYDVHDFWDLGEFDQNDSVATKYGTKADLEEAISALHSEDIKAYTDTVFNHRMGANEKEVVDGEEVWTKYEFAGRDKYYNSTNYPDLYHDFDWDYNVFDSANGDLFSFKTWDVEDDYLMGSDVDYEHTGVTDEMKAWGQWIINDVNFDGFRLDAVKHVGNEFVGSWLDDVQSNTSKDVFTVGEAWIENTSDLEDYLDQVGNSDLRVFDFPLRSSFVELSSGDKDLSSWGAWDGLVHERPSQAVTFVDNHDTSREGNPYDKPQIEDFKNQAYAYMLMRENGVPTVYARDYTEFNMAPALDKMVKARRYFAYGAGHEVSNNSHDVYSYVREGLDDVAGDGLVMMISDGTSGNTATKNIDSRQPDTTFYDFTGNVSGTVTTDADGYGDFSVKESESNGWSIWVPTNN